MSSPLAVNFNTRMLSCMSIERQYLEKLYETIFNPESSKAEIIKCINSCNAASYVFGVNTDRADSVVDDYNDNLKKLMNQFIKDKSRMDDRVKYVNSKISSPFKLEKFSIKKGQFKTRLEMARWMLSNTKCEDVFTKNYKKVLGILKSKFDNEYNMIFLGKEANNKGHFADKGIENIRDNISFKKKEMKKGEFINKIDATRSKLKSIMKARHKEDLALPEEQRRPDYDYDAFNYYLECEKVAPDNAKNLVKFNKGKDSYDMLVSSIDSKFPTEELHTENGKDIDDSFVKSVADSIELKKMSEEYFALKENSVMALMVYQKKVIEECQKEGIDPYESGRLTHHVELVETGEKLSDGRDSFRVVVYSHEGYKKYIEFNNQLVRSNKFREEMADATRHYETSDIDNSIRDLAKNQKREFLDEYEVSALMDECEFETFHLPKDELINLMFENKIKHVDVTKNPLVEQLAFKGTDYKGPMHNTLNDEKVNQVSLKRVEEANIKGKEAVNGNYEKHVKINNVRDAMVNIFREKE